MSNHASHVLEVRFSGAVFSLFVTVEGQEIDLRFDGDSTWQRTITGFVVTGPLDVACLAKGLSQTECVLQITLDGTVAGEFKGTISAKGIWQIVRSIPVPGAERA
ncbi:MAG TPA: hypothetical protein VGK89_10880 [Candidatus Eisenbacteria bacterium]|jgi:hypothetical protein